MHVPFCARKCEYCAFYSEAADGAVVNRYLGALISELEMVAGDLKPRTIFFGGGTPSLLNLRQWERILSAMERLNLLDAEVSDIDYFFESRLQDEPEPVEDIHFHAAIPRSFRASLQVSF